MACIGSSAPRREVDSPQRCSVFHRWTGLIEEFLRLSPFGNLMFAAPAAANGLSRPPEHGMSPGSRALGRHSLCPRDSGARKEGIDR